jgi:Glu-tRNA(Gln) amidotransferase subunit E-like FAD-binding protein
MVSTSKYLSLLLILAACSTEPEKVVIEYRYIGSNNVQKTVSKQEPKTLTEKASSYMIESGLAKKLWKDLPDEKKWNLIRSIIDYEAKGFASRQINRIQDNFKEFYNFCQETKGRLVR